MSPVPFRHREETLQRSERKGSVRIRGKHIPQKMKHEEAISQLVTSETGDGSSAPERPHVREEGRGERRG